MTDAARTEVVAMSGSGSGMGQGVSATAVAAAAARAVESSRADRLFDDPLARLLVEAADVPVRFPLTWPQDPAGVPPQQLLLLVGSAYVGLRTRFVDDQLTQVPPGSRPEQVVLLGAGLDTRVHRLAWTGRVTVFEVDQPHVLAFKDRVLSTAGFTPACGCRNVPVDVTGDWQGALLTAGLDRARPTSWVVEGLLPYLPADGQRNVLDGIVALSAPASRVVVERAPALPNTPEAEERLAQVSRQTGVPLAELLARTGPPDPAGLLADAGWQVEKHPVARIAETYRRPLVDPGLAAALAASGGATPGSGGAPSAAAGGFVTGVRPDASPGRPGRGTEP